MESFAVPANIFVHFGVPQLYKSRPALPLSGHGQKQHRNHQMLLTDQSGRGLAHGIPLHIPNIKKPPPVERSKMRQRPFRDWLMTWRPHAQWFLLVSPPKAPDRAQTRSIESFTF